MECALGSSPISPLRCAVSPDSLPSSSGCFCSDRGSARPADCDAVVENPIHFSLSVARAERLPMPRRTAVPSIRESKGWTSDTSDASSALRLLAPPQKVP